VDVLSTTQVFGFEWSLRGKAYAGKYGPLTVHELFPSLTKRFLVRHPCRLFSVSYE